MGRLVNCHCQSLFQNPNDYRSRFYLAQSYRDAGKLEEARKHYLIRAEMTGDGVRKLFTHVTRLVVCYGGLGCLIR